MIRKKNLIVHKKEETHPSSDFCN